MVWPRPLVCTRWALTLETFMCSTGRYAMKPIVQFDERLHIRVALGRMKKCLLLYYILEFVLYLRVCVTFESLCYIWDLVLYLSFVLYLRFWQRSSCLGREDRPSPSMQRTINVIKSLFENFGTSLVLAHQRSIKVITEALDGGIVGLWKFPPNIDFQWKVPCMSFSRE